MTRAASSSRFISLQKFLNCLLFIYWGKGIQITELNKRVKCHKRVDDLHYYIQTESRGSIYLAICLSAEEQMVFAGRDRDLCMER